MADGLVGVVILSWNGLSDTLGCLASLSAVSYPELATIVVDNGSSDHVAEVLAEAYPSVEVIRSESNLGFAGGSNLGIVRALERGCSYVLLLNNDIEVEADFVAALVEAAASRPRAGALCSKVLFLDPPDRIWFAGADYDPGAGYNGRQRGYGELDDGRFDAVVESDRACGASMLIPRAVLEEVGDFDAALFAYCEDSDWSVRARRAGYVLYVVPASRVWHKVSGSTGGESSPSTLYYGLRNALELAERYAPLEPARDRRRRAVLVTVHVLQALRSRRRLAGLRAVADGYRDQRAGRFGQRSAR